MITLSLTEEEARLVRNAVKAFYDDFGHEEHEVHAPLRSALRKLDEAMAQAREAG